MLKHGSWEVRGDEARPRGGARASRPGSRANPIARDRRKGRRHRGSAYARETHLPRLLPTTRAPNLALVAQKIDSRPWLSHLINESRLTPRSRPPSFPFFTAGTIFLFDRKAVRFFRKDGHDWQKKKDGKTVRETHEKLKVHGEYKLVAYYSTTADATLQRRVYRQP